MKEKLVEIIRSPFWKSIRMPARKLNRISQTVKYREVLNTYRLSRIWIIMCKPVLPQFATKNHAVTRSLFPPPRWDWEKNQKEKGKTRGL